MEFGSKTSLTTITVDGEPTALIPITTAFPSDPACGAYVYARPQPASEEPTLVAYDPHYADRYDSGASSCFPSAISMWWLQPRSSIYTALGPSFQCPEAYAPVKTVVVAGTLQQTYCCPKGYSLDRLQSNKPQEAATQCYRLLTKGATASYYTVNNTTTSIATTVVRSSISVFGVPVNGFNIPNLMGASEISVYSIPVTVTATPTPESSSALPLFTGSASSRGSRGSPDDTEPESSPSTPLTAGAKAGAAVGAIVGTALIAGILFYLFRRKKKEQSRGNSAHEHDYESSMGQTNQPSQKFSPTPQTSLASPTPPQSSFAPLHRCSEQALESPPEQQTTQPAQPPPPRTSSLAPDALHHTPSASNRASSTLHNAVPSVSTLLSDDQEPGHGATSIRSQYSGCKQSPLSPGIYELSAR